MKVLVAFQGDSGSNTKVAEQLKKSLEARDCKVELQPVLPKKKKKWFHHIKDFRKNKKIALKKAIIDVKKFDLVIVGTSVWTYKPTPVITTYLRSLEHTRGKKFVLFATCVGVPGTTIKRMSNILSTKAAKVQDNFVIRSIFTLDKKKLTQVKEFAESLKI